MYVRDVTHEQECNTPLVVTSDFLLDFDYAWALAPHISQATVDTINTALVGIMVSSASVTHVTCDIQAHMQL